MRRTIGFVAFWTKLSRTVDVWKEAKDKAVEQEVSDSEEERYLMDAQKKEEVDGRGIQSRARSKASQSNLKFLIVNGSWSTRNLSLTRMVLLLSCTTSSNFLFLCSLFL